ncbi:hypothetical protein M9H77_23710 [Catharanthus roseus]|uniref:Uncharacterized protein n=1 Tax=Catharanthus roseus TaxID=4058 RepID=A0ACC0AVB6_CATRO|nr:hypothetical protein M9H77_23710 [Catharanthus roseus]
MVWQDLKETMRSLQLQLNSVEKNLRNTEKRLDQRGCEYAKSGYYRNLGYQEYHERILNTKIDKGIRIEVKVWGETLKKIIRATKVLGIPTWMTDMEIGIFMNKELDIMRMSPTKEDKVLSS